MTCSERAQGLKPDALLRRDGLPCRPMILANCRSRPPCLQGLAEPFMVQVLVKADTPWPKLPRPSSKSGIKWRFSANVLATEH
jgi:hypothetical protein